MKKEVELLIQEDWRGFQWDAGNAQKNWHSHQVAVIECEQIFLNDPLLLLGDIRHSKKEKRYHALGITDMGRHLLIVFTVRKDLIRVISARDMNKKERTIYEKA